MQLMVHVLDGRVLKIAFAAEMDKQEAEAPVYRNGESWTFSARSKSHDGSNNSNLLNGEFEITYEKGRRRIFRIDGDIKVEHNTPGFLNIMLPVPGVRNNITKFFEFPLAIGRTWKTEFFHERYRRWVSPVTSVVGVERVNTPAGVFSAYRIERTLSFSRFVAEGEERHYYHRQTYFYSPEARCVVKHNVQGEYQSFGDRDLFVTTDVELTKIGRQR
jgi:hypothetical protein